MYRDLWIDLPEGQRQLDVPVYVGGADAIAYAASCSRGHFFFVSIVVGTPCPECPVCASQGLL